MILCNAEHVLIWDVLSFQARRSGWTVPTHAMPPICGTIPSIATSSPTGQTANYSSTRSMATARWSNQRFCSTWGSGRGTAPWASRWTRERSSSWITYTSNTHAWALKAKENCWFHLFLSNDNIRLKKWWFQFFLSSDDIHIKYAYMSFEGERKLLVSLVPFQW